jgi:hypothetical protein
MGQPRRAAIPVQGGDVKSVAKIIDPAQISPQIAQFIQMAVSDTQSNLGATNSPWAMRVRRTPRPSSRCRRRPPSRTS